MNTNSVPTNPKTPMFLKGVCSYKKPRRIERDMPPDTAATLCVCQATVF